jgi:hypothetical protein
MTTTPSISSKPTLPLIVQDALEKTIGLKENDKDKKWKEIAAGLDLSEGILRNKVAREKEDKRHHLSLAEAIAIPKIANDNALVHAICTSLGGVFVPRPSLNIASDEELLGRYTCMMNELGKFSIDIHTSLADGKISATEISNLRKDFLALTAALSEVMDRLQIKAERDAETSSLCAEK